MEVFAPAIAILIVVAAILSVYLPPFPVPQSVSQRVTHQDVKSAQRFLSAKRHFFFPLLPSARS